MAHLERVDLPCPATGTGPGAIVPWRWSLATVYVSGPFVAEVDIETSADGTHWVVQSGITSENAINVTALALYVRANVSQYTSGTPRVQLVGLLSGG